MKRTYLFTDLLEKSKENFRNRKYSLLLIVLCTPVFLKKEEELTNFTEYFFSPCIKLGNGYCHSNFRDEENECSRETSNLWTEILPNQKPIFCQLHWSGWITEQSILRCILLNKFTNITAVKSWSRMVNLKREWQYPNLLILKVLIKNSLCIHLSAQEPHDLP